jgi:hypothetical protein
VEWPNNRKRIEETIILNKFGLFNEHSFEAKYKRTELAKLKNTFAMTP